MADKNKHNNPEQANKELNDAFYESSDTGGQEDLSGLTDSEQANAELNNEFYNDEETQDPSLIMYRNNNMAGTDIPKSDKDKKHSE